MVYNRTHDIAKDIADRLEDDDLINMNALETPLESRNAVIDHIEDVLKSLIIINSVDVVRQD